MFTNWYSTGQRAWPMLLVLLALSLGCSPETQVEPGSAKSLSDEAPQQALRNRIAAMRSEPQQFGLSGSEVSSLTGELGTQLKIVPADLMTASGAAITGDLILELIELPYAEDMAQYQLSSYSPTGLLSMGGAIHLTLRTEGEEVVLREGKTLEVAFPCRQLGSMTLCYGAQDSLGDVVWNPSQQLIRTDSKRAADHLATKPGAQASDEELAQQLVIERDSLGIAGTSLQEFPMDSRDFTALDAAKRRRAVHTYGVCSPVGITQLGWVSCATPGTANIDCKVALEGAVDMKADIWVWALVPEHNALLGPVRVTGGKSNVDFKLPTAKAVRFLALTTGPSGYLMGSHEQSVTAGPASAIVKLAPASDAVVRHYLAQPLAL